MFMFTELEGREESRKGDGGVGKSEGAGDRGEERGEEEKETMQYGEIIREVRLGRIKKSEQENWRKRCKEIKYVRRQRKRTRL